VKDGLSSLCCCAAVKELTSQLSVPYDNNMTYAILNYPYEHYVSMDYKVEKGGATPETPAADAGAPGNHPSLCSLS